MTTTPIEDWRGASAEENDDISERGTVFLRRRSRALLGDLLRPYARWIWVLVVVVVLENAARLSIPWLVRRGIDLGVPPLLAGGSGRFLYETVALMAGAVLVQGAARMFFCTTPARWGRRCCWSYGAGCSGTSRTSTCASTSATPPAGWSPG